MKADELIAMVRETDPARGVSLGRVERRIERTIAARRSRGASLFVALALCTAGAAAAAMSGVFDAPPPASAVEAPLPAVTSVRQRRVIFVRPPLVEEPVRAASPALRGSVAEHGPAQTSTPSIPVEGPSIEAPLPDHAPPTPSPVYVPRGVRELGYVP